MFEKARKAIDAFSFSLGGMRMTSSFVIAPAIDGDRINRIRDAHLSMLETRRSEAAGTEERPATGGTELCVQNA
ncbi:MAG: hypothetical protein KJO09_13265 [Gammaproteobacteria bacterium]|nr:hypothetical protein [Gammaproteobacteria bacterium]